MKKFTIFTGTRAEYGLMKYLIKALTIEKDFETNLIVAASHLSPKFGETINEIKVDGIEPSFYIPLRIDSEENGMCLQTADIMIEVSKVLKELNPDYLILLGDRFETFGTAAAGHLLGIKIIHIHGGESTLGAIDNKLRHAISQLSTLHFTSAKVHKERVEKMGFPQDKVFNVGPMAIDGILNTIELNKKEFSRKTNFIFGQNNFLVTFHPETLSSDLGMEGLDNLLKVLKEIDCNILFTSPNADKGFELILKKIKAFVIETKPKSIFIPSLGQELYLNALRLLDCVIGNSSSGIVEAPLIGANIINIGNRQEGRFRFGKVINVNKNYYSIKNAINDSVSKSRTIDNKNNFSEYKKLRSPSKAILDVLRNYD